MRKPLKYGRFALINEDEKMKKESEKEMNLSIIIPDHNDLRLIDLVDSIDYASTEKQKVELVLVLNKPTVELLQLVDKIKIKYCKKFDIKSVLIEICNLGYAYNAGIENASYDNIMFLDSDLICIPNAIKKMVQCMEDKNAKIVKGIVWFEHNGFITKLISNTRKVTTSKVKKAYIPVLLMNKNIFQELDDGYMFAVDTVWCADADFANRVDEKKIPVKYIKSDFLHPAIGLKKDLKDALYYGFGKGIRTKRTGESWKPCREVADLVKSAKKERLSFLEYGYLVFWGTIMQFGCLMQLFLPNHFFFPQSMKFDEGKV